MLEAGALGVLIGLSVGLLGGGGSVLAVPLLVYVLGQSVEQATTASLAVVAAGAVSGAVTHARAHRVCWRHAGSLSLAAIPGIVVGTLAGQAVSGSLLLVGFAGVMVVAARATWRRAGAPPADDAGWRPGTSACPPLRLPRDLLAGAGIGLVTGFFGIGGGFLVVPTLAVALAFTMRTAIGTSLAIITATSLFGFATHLLAGRTVDVDLTAAMALGCVAGAIVGAAFAGVAPQRTLGRAFAVFVCGIAVWLVASVVVMGGPPGA